MSIGFNFSVYILLLQKCSIIVMEGKKIPGTLSGYFYKYLLRAIADSPSLQAGHMRVLHNLPDY